MTREQDKVNPTPEYKDRPRKPGFIRSQSLDYDTNKASQDTALVCTDPSLARQEFAEESDINFIADRYGLTGEMPQIEGAMWGQEFVGTFDFQQAQNQIIEARRQFEQLPAKIRNRFDNDPAKLIAFLENDDNRAEAEFLELVKKRPEPVIELPTGAPEGKGKRANPAPEPELNGDPIPSKKDKKDT